MNPLEGGGRTMRDRITEWHLRVTPDVELAHLRRRLEAELAARTRPKP